MSADESRQRRQLLIEQLRASGALRDEAVASAFRAVPRELFLPGLPLDQVYQDQAIVTKEENGVGVSSSSQPAIMAIMLQQLDVRPGMQVLEIGAGTGYNAALLQQLVTDSGRVVTVDIDPEVAGWARERLRAAGYPRVAVVRADGAGGYAPAAPYDRVQLTVGTAEIAPAWAAQLYPSGRLVLPLWVNTAQLSVCFEKRGDHLFSRSLQPCGFMAIRGALAGPNRYAPLTDDLMVMPGRSDLPLDELRRLLGRPGGNQPVPLGLTPGWGFTLWLALRGDRVLGVIARESAVGFSGAGFGLYLGGAEPGIALLVLPADDSRPADLVWFGATGARDALLRELAAWRAAGEPVTGDFELAACPRATAPRPARDQVAVDTAHWRLLFTLPGAALASA
ncbi:MAG TPA: methyltransferase domain-containing protein [Thermomicrobiaceae bacterium]|nr:methyltransferase domain-containing protein [Thermomicrobiaceae bacterium]